MQTVNARLFDFYINIYLFKYDSMEDPLYDQILPNIIIKLMNHLISYCLT